MSTRSRAPESPREVPTGTPLGPPRMLPQSQEGRRGGVTVTAVHDDGPPFYTFHIGGAPGGALVAACERLDAMGDGWHIASISTARSIYRDLQGTRQNHAPRLRVSVSNHDAALFAEDPRSTELSMLRQIGRLDLLRPLPLRIGGHT